MSDFIIVEPIEITDGMVGSGAGTVPEGDYAEFSFLSTYDSGNRVIVKGTTEQFSGNISLSILPSYICAAPNGDIYAVDTDSYSIFMRAHNEDLDAFVYVESTFFRKYRGICARPNGDIYVCISTTDDTGDILKRTGGNGAFASLSQADREWRAMCASDSHVYACVYGGDIYKQTNGTGDFAAMSAGNKNWSAMCYDPASGDVYAAEYGGDIYVLTDEAGAWNAIADTDRNWNALTHNGNGDIIAAVASGYIYKRTAGAGTFAAVTSTAISWTGLTYDEITGDLYGSAGTLLYYTGADAIHKIYESLIGSNTGNYPPTDVEATTPKWLEISATNKWKVFDSKTADQMVKLSPAVYTITPGEAFDSVVLLNLEATSVTIAVDAPAYSQTVNTGATDIVKTDLAGDASSVLTITITNSAGLSKCGEIIVGNASVLGTMKPYPNVGIIDYSVKTQDEWGNWSITERAYSEKMNCLVNVSYASLDAAIAVLKQYRASPLVFIGSSSYSCLIVYGFLKDWSVPVSTRGKSILSIEVEGLT